MITNFIYQAFGRHGGSFYMNSNNQFDVIIIGAGPGGIFSAYELMQKKPDLKVACLRAVTLWRNATARSMA